MKREGSIPRRTFLRAGAAGVATLAVPTMRARAWAQGSEPIVIGVPTAITGTWAALGVQVVRTCKLVAKEVEQRGGILGRKVEFLFEDTQGNPANCVRKAQEMVERHKVNLFTGIMASSEALAVSAKLAEWNAFFLSSINGAGELTAEKYVPNFFRANTSGPMGARTIAVYLKDAPQKTFYAIGLDYAWGHSSVAVFEKEIQRAGKEFVGKVFAPTGTKDYSTYITRIRQANPDGLYVAITGDDGTAFYQQAAQFKLGEKIQMVTELVDMLNLKPAGEATLGLIGSSRYTFMYETPENQAFVKRFQAEFKEAPDTFDGEQYQALQILFKAIEKARSTDTAALVKAMAGLEVTSVKGKVVMRECDHQGSQQGFVVKAVKRQGFAHPVPEVVKTYPADIVTPPCRKSSYS
ncbi:MAG: ABC transporter substrate-binding protein [Candidatus Rokubacteria bacterium]|nr:ABC transporter substrate-binding protein [Candidatus Rokubacteria bacterium]